MVEVISSSFPSKNSLSCVIALWGAAVAGRKQHLLIAAACSTWKRTGVCGLTASTVPARTPCAPAAKGAWLDIQMLPQTPLP